MCIISWLPCGSQEGGTISKAHIFTCRFGSNFIQLLEEIEPNDWFF